MENTHDGEIPRKCPVCLKQFRAARRSAIYCSSKCRVRAHRKPEIKEILREHYDAAQSAINGIAMYADRADFEGYRAQQNLKALIIQALEYANEDTRRKIYEDLRSVTSS